jgi:hypothetical protein
LRREAPIPSRAKYNNVYPISCLDISQDLNIFRMKTENFSRKVLVVRKKAVPLHPLSLKSWAEALKKSSLKDLHRQK